jgi:predicted AlkP superfamily pyrophosphatase or phosphodiesterase
MSRLVRARRAALPAIVLLASITLLFASSAVAQQPTVSLAVPSSKSDRSVILISVDGLRPDAIQVFQAATMRNLIDEGSYTLNASTILPSKTLPSHASMLTGELPERHGVLWNNEQIFSDGELQSPTIFSVLRSSGFKTAAFFSKSKFDDFQVPGTVDYTQAPDGWLGGLIPGRWDADRTASDAMKYMKRARPDFMFVHFGDVDYAGHRSGWMSEKYGKAVKKVDASIAQLLTAAKETYDDYTVIVTSDHGGHGKDHGSDDPQDVTIPWIASGNGITPGPISDKVRTMDTASTVLWLFGVSEPTDWEGAPVTAAFSQRERGGLDSAAVDVAP